jgi:hypothetical protein
VDALTRAAIAGTSREAPPAGDLPTDDLLGSTERSPERDLLLRAGMRAVYGAAGRRAESGTEAPEPAPGETLPPCSAKAAEIVRPLFTGRRDEILSEALERLRLAGLRLPHALLPAALDVQRNELRQSIVAVLGERGRWLAGFDPAWGWAVATTGGSEQDDETVWQEGALPQRLEALRRVRGRDAEQGRRWVEEAWKSEKADARTAFIEALEHGLSLGDEAFLERALDDRSVKVRGAAAALLAGLPGSAYAARAAARADALLGDYEPSGRGFLRRRAGRLVVQPPEEPDDAWLRDLPGAGDPVWGVGEKARSVARIVEAVPPEHWEERFGLDPEAIVAALEGDEWEAAVLIGWCRAAASRGNRAWALPLWERCYRLPSGDAEQRAAWDVVLFNLVGCLDRISFARATSRLLDGGEMPERLSQTLMALPGPWGESLSRVYCEALRERARVVFSGRRTTIDAHWPNTFQAAAARLSPSCLERARVNPPQPPAGEQENHIKGYWRRELEKFEETLELRRKLVEEIPL